MKRILVFLWLVGLMVSVQRTHAQNADLSLTIAGEESIDITKTVLFEKEGNNPPTEVMSISKSLDAQKQLMDLFSKSRFIFFADMHFEVRDSQGVVLLKGKWEIEKTTNLWSFTAEKMEIDQDKHSGSLLSIEGKYSNNQKQAVILFIAIDLEGEKSVGSSSIFFASFIVPKADAA